MVLKLIKSVILASAAVLSTAGNSQTCEGGWQYEQWNKCRQETNPCEATVTNTVYKPCRAPVKDDRLGCGPEVYQLCQNTKCPGTIPDRMECLQWDGPDCVRLTMVPGKPGTCRGSFCPVEVWKFCQHNSCEVDLANTTTKCTQYAEGYSSTCGGTKALSVTLPGAGKPSAQTIDGKNPLDFYEIGSACITCDDIPEDSVENIQKKFDCLAKGITLAEQQKAGYSFKSTFYILQQLQKIGNQFSANLTQTQSARLIEILTKYNIGG